LRIVAFIQDEATNKVYQAAMDTIGIMSGIDDPLPGQPRERTFVVFPNPSALVANVKFNSPITEDITLELYNNLGSLIFEKKVPKGTRETSIPVEDYPDGVYIIRIINQDELIGISKLTISKLLLSK
jgi:hypothetical protein